MYDQESEYPIVSDAFGKVDGFELSCSHMSYTFHLLVIVMTQLLHWVIHDWKDQWLAAYNMVKVCVQTKHRCLYRFTSIVQFDHGLVTLVLK